MSKAFDAKQSALKAYPERSEDGVEALLDYLDASAKDFEYDMGMSAEEYLYGKKQDAGQPITTNPTTVVKGPSMIPSFLHPQIEVDPDDGMITVTWDNGNSMTISESKTLIFFTYSGDGKLVHKKVDGAIIRALKSGAVAHPPVSGQTKVDITEL